MLSGKNVIFKKFSRVYLIFLKYFRKPVARLQEEQCKHNMVMKEMCCDCGADLRK